MKKNPVIITATITARKPAMTPEFQAEGNAAKRARAFLELLRRNHIAISEMLPLQIEVNKKLHGMYPTVPRKIVNMAMYYHTASIGYLESIVKGYGRFTVDKVFVEDISKEDRERTLILFKKIKNKLFRQAQKQLKPKTAPSKEFKRSPTVKRDAYKGTSPRWNH